MTSHFMKKTILRNFSLLNSSLILLPSSFIDGMQRIISKIVSFIFIGRVRLASRIRNLLILLYRSNFFAVYLRLKDLPYNLIVVR